MFNYDKTNNMAEQEEIQSMTIDQAFGLEPMTNEPTTEVIVPSKTIEVTTDEIKTETPVEGKTEIPVEAKTEIPKFELTDEIRINAINEQFGTTYTSLEEVKAVKDDFAALPTYKEYKAKFEEASKVTPIKFANSKIEELNAFAAATNIDDVGLFHAINRFQNAEKKDPIEAMVLAQIIERPELIDKKDLLREMIEEKYNLAIDEDMDKASEERRIEKVKLGMEFDSSSANKLITDTIGKVQAYKATIPANTEKQNQQNMESNLSAWKPTLSDNKFKDLFKSVEVDVPLGKTSDGVELGTEKVSIELSAEQRKFIEDNVNGMVSSGLEYSQDNINKVIDVQRNVALLQNFNSIVAKSVETAVAKAEMEFLKKTHNVSSIKVETPTTTEPTKTHREQVEDMIMNA